MYQETKLKPMSNFMFRCAKCLMYVWDIFLRHPRRDIEKLPLKAGMTVVDYGCGPGHYTIPLAEVIGPSGRVYAVDIQPLAVATVKKQAARKSLNNITTVLVNSYDTGMPDSTADIVLLLDTFHMISDPDALFREISRLLKPDGFLLMDPGHMKAVKAKTIVERSGLFNMVRFDGRNMQLAKCPKI